MTHITGIGGVFIKSQKVEDLKKWYQKHLGVSMDQYGAMFKSRNFDDPAREEMTIWGFFKQDSDYFDPSEKDFMINFRVHDLDGLLEDLKSQGIEQCGQLQEFEYGRFAWIVDPEGTKIELWEPPGNKP